MVTKLKNVVTTKTGVQIDGLEFANRVERDEWSKNNPLPHFENTSSIYDFWVGLGSHATPKFRDSKRWVFNYDDIQIRSKVNNEFADGMDNQTDIVHLRADQLQRIVDFCRDNGINIK